MILTPTNYLARHLTPQYGRGGRDTSSAYLLQEDFEGSEYDLTWTESGTGTIDGDYTTSPAPLNGAQSLRLAMNSHNGRTKTVLSADQDTLYVFFRMNWVSISSMASGKVFFSIVNSSNSDILTIEKASSSANIRVRVGSANAATVSTISTSTTYNVWLRYTKGTGSNAIGSIGFSTSTTEPTSGNDYASVSTGTSTTQANAIMFGSVGNDTWESIFDKVRCKTTSIGDNPS